MDISCALVVVDGWIGVVTGVASQGSTQAVSNNPRQRIIVRMNFMMRDSTTQEFAHTALWRSFLIGLVWLDAVRRFGWPVRFHSQPVWP
jgi:hypothetical protein